MNRTKPLYRRVNTTAHGAPHRQSRIHGHEDMPAHGEAGVHGSMHGKQRKGLDYTPLFKFLQSRVGQDWDAVHSEAVSRLDDREPISWIVAQSQEEGSRYIRIGENSFYRGLYVDSDNKLALVDPGLEIGDMSPGCACCTHTLDGIPFTREYGFAGPRGP